MSARRNFHVYDVDGDGVISRQDFENAMMKHDLVWGDASKKAELDDMYAAVDIDGTGRVDFLKFAAMRVRKKEWTEDLPPSTNPKNTSAGRKSAWCGVTLEKSSALSFLGEVNPFPKIQGVLCCTPRGESARMSSFIMSRAGIIGGAPPPTHRD